MKIGVPREIYAGEKRVATTPEVAAQLMKLGFDVAAFSPKNRVLQSPLFAKLCRARWNV